MKGTGMNELNETLKQALAVAPTQPQQALELLKAGLEKARRSGNRHGVSILARHMGSVLTGSGELLGALQCYDEALRADPEDAYLHFATGDIYRTLGRDEQARIAFRQSLALATEQGDVDMIKMAVQAQADFDGEGNDESTIDRRQN